jgi:hypothetical protein
MLREAVFATPSSPSGTIAGRSFSPLAFTPPLMISTCWLVRESIGAA